MYRRHGAREATALILIWKNTARVEYRKGLRADSKHGSLWLYWRHSGIPRRKLRQQFLVSEMAALTWLRAYLSGNRKATGMVKPRLRDGIGFV